MRRVKKILIIPSWYASRNNSIVGSFFKEQGELLWRNGFDIKVLYGIPEMEIEKTPKRKRVGINAIALKIIRPKNELPAAESKKTELLTCHLIQDPPALSFLIQIPFGAAEPEQFDLNCSAYHTALRMLMEDGWIPDIIHAQSTLEAGIYASYLSEKLSIPFVIIEHQVFLLNHYSAYKQQLVLDALAKAKKVAVVSEHQKKCVLMNQPECNPSVIWNLINENLFKIRTRKTNDHFTIVTITYPSPVKDYKTFFNAIKELSGYGEDFRFLVIGNDSFGDITNANCEVFINYSKELGIDHLGTFVPHLNRNEIADTLSQCDVFVSTSIAETFGIAAREAMMCGLPVVTTANGGVEDSITEATGITVPIRDHKSIAHAILKIKNNDHQYVPQKIREHVIKQCGQEAFLNKMNAFYTIGDLDD